MGDDIRNLEARKALYYGLGHLAYAVAMADGAIQAHEERQVQKIVAEGARQLDFDMDLTEIVFHILSEEKLSSETVFDWGMQELAKGQRLITQDIVDKFAGILEQVAAAYPPITQEEQDVVDRFRNEVIVTV